MPRKPKPVILNGGQLIEREQRAQLTVVEERQRLAIEEANHQHRVRAGCLDRLTTSANVTVQDLFRTTEDGNLEPRKIQDLPREVARAIKKVKIWTTTTTKDNVTTTVQAVELEVAHHLDYDEKIGKYLGLWANDNKHLHLHQNAPGAEIPKKLADLSPGEIRALRTRLEKEVEMLSITNSTEEQPCPKK